MAVINPETYNPEVYTSGQVYGMVVAEALPLSIMNTTPSERRDALYHEVGIVPVALEPAQVYLRGHRGLVSDQTTQTGRSYKIRGSGNAILHARTIDPDVHTVHICSAGNAAQGAVQAARRYGIQVVCEATQGASSAKLNTLRREGAIVNAVHPEFEDGRQAAILQGEQHHHASIEAYDQVETIAGQATVGWETLSDLLGRSQRGEISLHTDPIKLFVPVGGGGLIAGIACVIKWAKDEGLLGRNNVHVIGVQMEGCDALKRSADYTRAGYEPPKDLFAVGPPFDPSCDGTAVRKPGRLTSAIVADPTFVTDILAITPGELGVAMDEATKRHGQSIEPAGALSLAGAKRYAETHPFDRRGPAETLITFTTGANVSPETSELFRERAATWRQQRAARAAAGLVAYRNKLWDLSGRRR